MKTVIIKTGTRMAKPGIELSDFKPRELEVTSQTKNENAVASSIGDDGAQEKVFINIPGLLYSYSKGNLSSSPFAEQPEIVDGVLQNEIQLKPKFELSCADGVYLN